MSVEESLVLIEQAGAVATLTLNRPAAFNVLSSAMLEALQAALDALRANKGVRVVVIAGAGRAFCAGHDLKELRAHSDFAWHSALFERCSKLMLSLADLPQPVIASVRGIATAAGCQLVAACDLAIAGEHARFATSGVNLGLFCSTPAIAITRTLATKHAAELLFCGDFINAQRAEQWGLVNRVVGDAELSTAAASWAAAIAAKSGAALASGKALLRAQHRLSLAEAYNAAGINMARDMKSTDAAAGIDAFLQKKAAPDWLHQ
jgi:enoyl-CoA hydratase/carnithine racemase